MDKLDAAQASEKGLLIRRSLALMAALKLGVRISLEDIKADEFQAMPIVAEEGTWWNARRFLTHAGLTE